MPAQTTPSLQHLTQPELLEKARNQATFNSSKLTEVILGDKRTVKQYNEVFARVEKAIGSDDLSKLPRRYANLNQENLILEGMRAGRVIINDGIDNGHQIFRECNQEWILANSNPLGLTGALFTPMLKLQGTAEQLAYWLPLSETGKLVGSYTQKEVGHGTFVGGIQTTATFDKKTDEFVIHTPSVSAIKHWPGALGSASTHTITMAQLIIDGKTKGPHSFVMQLRSTEDFKPLPGVELGDIGPKMAYNSTDNGYASFDHVRIPRTALLARYNTVDKDGTYKAHHLRGKLLYGGLSGGRLLIIRNSAFQLAQALTIATRYSVVRQQGESRDPIDNPETQIIHYKLQHYRLLTLISRAYANVFASKSVHAVHKEMQAEQASGNHRLLSTFHVLSSGLKAWATQTAADGAEDARKMCGGHGYLMISGLPDIVLSVTAACIFEGENVVMWKQVSSYLMKSMAADSLPEDMAYMNRFQDPDSTGSYGDSDVLRPEILLEIFEHRAARLSNEIYVQLQQAKGSRAQAENRFAVELHIAARAHIDVFILRSFIEHISAITLPPIKAVLTRLLLLHALTTISSPLSISSATFHFSYTQIGVMRQHTNDILEQLLPDAVALTDAFNFTDASLASALGCRDGNVYERLMSWTRQLPINVQAQAHGGVWKQGWEEGVKPFLEDGKVRQARAVKRGRL